MCFVVFNAVGQKCRLDSIVSFHNDSAGVTSKSKIDCQYDINNRVTNIVFSSGLDTNLEVSRVFGVDSIIEKYIHSNTSANLVSIKLNNDGKDSIRNHYTFNPTTQVISILKGSDSLNYTNGYLTRSTCWRYSGSFSVIVDLVINTFVDDIIQKTTWETTLGQSSVANRTTIYHYLPNDLLDKIEYLDGSYGYIEQYNYHSNDKISSIVQKDIHNGDVMISDSVLYDKDGDLFKRFQFENNGGQSRLWLKDSFLIDKTVFVSEIDLPRGRMNIEGVFSIEDRLKEDGHMISDRYITRYDNGVSAPATTHEIFHYCANSASTDHSLENEYSIQLFPNPNTGRFNLKSEIDIITVELYNQSGELIKIYSPKTKDFLVEIEKQGLYFVHVFMKNTRKVVKMVVLE